ncbi:hypothetical protein R3P38DRAFT_3342057 [Favolaschia claudopus]|uniref:Uncharacterized protein n=1 Tax=Favolaschia claudopus TaxID=2862362 RepID=A0AAW0E450_9AGAR
MLRDRCNVFLRVCTDRFPTSSKSKLPATLLSSAGNTPPATAEVRNRVLSKASPPPPVPAVLPLSPFILVDTPSDTRQFIPYLHLASNDASSSANPCTLPPGDWTHVVRILPATANQRAGSITIAASTSSTQILDLYVPGPVSHSQPTEIDTALPLRKRHILVARDFLALALPYYASAHPTLEYSSDSDASISGDADFTLPQPKEQPCRTDAVRVLLVGPPRATLAIALTYIAYASECSVAHVMRCVVEEGEDLEACEVLGKEARMGLGEREMQVLEGLAKKGL